MHLKRFRFLSPWLAIVALPLGIWSGRSLRATTAEQPNQQERFTQPTRSRARANGSATESGRADEKTTSLNPKEFFVVPPEAFQKIRVALLDGTSVNHEECQVLGLSETQIRELEQLVGDTVTRWREREKATMKIIPSTGPGTLIHIPAADHETAEREYKDLNEKARKISGEELGPLLNYRLTDGYSPSRTSNAGTGMLNVLTAGFGAMHRFVRIQPMLDGSSACEVIDVLPDRLEKFGVDEALFEKLASSENYQERQRLSSIEMPDLLSHLLQHP